MGVKLCNFEVTSDFYLFVDVLEEDGSGGWYSCNLAVDGRNQSEGISREAEREAKELICKKVLPLLYPIMDEAVRKMCDLTLNLEV